MARFCLKTLQIIPVESLVFIGCIEDEFLNSGKSWAPQKQETILVIIVVYAVVEGVHWTETKISGKVKILEGLHFH